MLGLVRIAAIAMLLLIVAACGEDNSTPANTPTVLPTEPPVQQPTSTAVSDADDHGHRHVVVESCGVEWEYDDVPQRALALDTNALQIFLILGLEDHVVGFFGNPDFMSDEFSTMANDAGVENLGGSWPYPALEAVLDPDPDFVFSYGFNVEGGFTPEAMQNAGINSYAFDEACIGFDGEVNIESLYRHTRDIGKIFDVEERAEDVIATWEARLDAVQAMIPDGVEAPRMFLLDFGEETIFTAAKGAMPTDLFARAGGVNIFADTTGADIAGTAWMNATHEEIVVRDPEVIVIVDYGWGEPEERPSFMESHPALSGITGVQNQNYIVLTFPQVIPSPENIDAIEILAEALWGAANGTSGVSLTDASGTVIELEQPAARIACLTGVCVDTLYVLGIVPVASNDALFLNEHYWGADGADIASIGGSFFEPNLEEIAAAEPDLVIGLSGVHEGLRPALESIAPLMVTNPAGLDGMRAEVRAIAKLVGREDAAERAIRAFDDRLAEVTASITDPETTIVIYGSDVNIGVTTLQAPEASLLDEISEYVFRDYAEPGSGYPASFSLEELLTLDPDHIFVQTIGFGAFEPVPLIEQFRDNPIWSNLTAVQNGNVYEVDFPLWATSRGLNGMGVVLEEALALMDLESGQ